MSTTRTRHALETTIELGALLDWARQYESIALDLGAGDGRFAREFAATRPAIGVIAVDTCGDNALRELRRAPENLRFLVADALALPEELFAPATEITINFPWGSLLRALLDGDERFLDVLAGRALTIRVNAGAMAEAGHTVESGTEALLRAVRRTHPRSLQLRTLDRTDLRQIPSTWAKRLAFGRDPRAIELSSRT